jgi:tetratricopeptide (TPR) repeat protein
MLQKRVVFLKKTIIIFAAFVLLVSALAFALTLHTNNLQFSKDPAFYKSLGNQLVREGQPLSAAAAYEKSLMMQEDSNLRNNLAVIYYQAGQYDDAIRNLLVLVESEPNNPSYHYDLAVNLVDRFRNTDDKKLDDLYTALSEYERANELSSGFSNAESNIAALKRVLKIE